MTEEKKGQNTRENAESCACEEEGKIAVHGGHRKRILERVKTGALCEHECLEVLLFSALPRKNTNDLAHRLLSEFGDMQGVFSATVEQLTRVEGIGENVACFIRTVGLIMQNMSVSAVSSYPKRFTLGAFARFMRREYGSLACEVLDVYVLDGTGALHGRRRCSSLRESKVEVQLQWLMRVLTDFNPSGIVLVHNHPFGGPSPSIADDATTAECRALCEKNGVILCDHFIYSPKGIYSYNLGRQLTEEDLKGAIDGGEDV